MTDTVALALIGVLGAGVVTPIVTTIVSWIRTKEAVETARLAALTAQNAVNEAKAANAVAVKTGDRAAVAGEKLAAKVEEVHGLVNSNTARMLDRIASLEAKVSDLVQKNATLKAEAAVGAKADGSGLTSKTPTPVEVTSISPEAAQTLKDATNEVKP